MWASPQGNISVLTVNDKNNPPKTPRKTISLCLVFYLILGQGHTQKGDRTGVGKGHRVHVRRRADPKVLGRVWRMRDRGMTFSSLVGMSREKKGARNMEEKQRGKDNPEVTSN